MRRVTAALSTAAVVLMAAGLFAQTKPNFAGKWVLEPSAEAAGGGGGRGGRGFGRGGLGQEITISQDAKTLTLEYTAGGQNPQPVKLVYNLDGTESKNSVPGRGGQQEQTAKAVWQGAKLVVTTTVDFNGNSFETTRAFSMDGANLKIENTNPGFGGNGPTTTTQTYNKAK